LTVKLNMARYKCYVVCVGHRPGVYYTWSECYEQVNGYPGARYKGFATVEEGNMAFRGIILRPTSSANDTVQIQAPSVVHETQLREAEEHVVYRDVAIALLRFTYIVVPTGTEPIHPRILHDDRFYPYFKELTYSMVMLKEESLTQGCIDVQWGDKN
ncbi:hypothetical protein Taro_018067, partial [Colocasia esculenta]|nr:hypothetical protein [Colocasia esculenta]